MEKIIFGRGTTLEEFAEEVAIILETNVSIDEKENTITCKGCHFLVSIGVNYILLTNGKQKSQFVYGSDNSKNFKDRVSKVIYDGCPDYILAKFESLKDEQEISKKLGLPVKRYKVKGEPRYYYAVNHIDFGKIYIDSDKKGIMSFSLFPSDIIFNDIKTRDELLEIKSKFKSLIDDKFDEILEIMFKLG